MLVCTGATICFLVSFLAHCRSKDNEEYQHSHAYMTCCLTCRERDAECQRLSSLPGLKLC